MLPPGKQAQGPVAAGHGGIACDRTAGNILQMGMVALTAPGVHLRIATLFVQQLPPALYLWRQFGMVVHEDIGDGPINVAGA